MLRGGGRAGLRLVLKQKRRMKEDRVQFGETDLKERIEYTVGYGCMQACRS